VLLIALVQVATSRVAVGMSEEASKFAEFKRQYNKTYVGEENAKRFHFFVQNLAIIDKLNKLPGDAVFGVGPFTDLSREEFASRYLMKPYTPTPKKGLVPKAVGAHPAQFDWRNKGKVTAVKNQEQCGSCWAFSTVENIESVWLVGGHGNNNTLALSPQQVVDCDQYDAGCDGGNPPTAYQYIISAGGLDSEATYPYEGVDQNCNFQPNNVVAKISNWKYACDEYDESTLETNLINWAPLSVCVDAANWQNYQSGVMGPWQCAWVNQLDHCVQLVGYNNNHSTPYWIVRNSWTTSWGIQGYIYLEKATGRSEVNTCGITNEASCAVL